MDSSPSFEQLEYCLLVMSKQDDGPGEVGLYLFPSLILRFFFRLSLKFLRFTGGRSAERKREESEQQREERYWK